MPFTFHRLEIPEVVRIEPRVFEDERGFFLETYRLPDFAASGIRAQFVQENHSHSVRGVLRGLHYQNPPFAQGKLVRVVEGEVFDVAVDIRRDSPTYGRWVAATLSARNRTMLYIPDGFAHGFLVLSDSADVIYKTTALYSPECEAGIVWNDRDLNIDWPLDEPVLAERDRQFPALKDADIRFFYGRET
jgi:dTDP-4-dehydrorhamnose 3,5-epimerase